MEYFTNFLGKRLLSLYEGEFIGTVLNGEFDQKLKKLKNLIIISTDEETTYLLPSEKIYSLSDIITIKNKSALTVSVEPITPTIIGAEVIGLSGAHYGKLREIGITPPHTQLLFSNIEIKANQIFHFENNLLIINDTNKQQTKSHFSPKLTSLPPISPLSTPTQTVNILDSNGILMPKTITAKNPK